MMHFGLIALLDRAVLRVAGRGSTKFLQGLCTQDVAALSAAPRRCIVPAAFLSAKGRVLCDALVFAGGPAAEREEFLLDIHSSMAAPILRLLRRHRLREKFIIENVTHAYTPVAELPAEAHPVNCVAAEDMEGFLPDPRFAALGRRALLTADEGKAVLERGLHLDAYHHWRLCCAVPEGPLDLPPNKALPFYSNLDLLGFLSFTKGCYIGQELTARTKFRGAVRRRFFTAVSLEEGEDGGGFLENLGVMPSAPLPAPVMCDSPTLPAGSKEGIEVRARSGDGKWKRAGILRTSSRRVALCNLRTRTDLKLVEALQTVPLPEGTELKAGVFRIALRPPPYAFAD
eukprot:NODE_7882_length_1542_cov_2.260777.p1 GENE.NODE_7882_length_1542_cov_2.260777~~NODE_7882_length_1542_cov_2.260777.p1  ORF type:complete len:378 (-),score=102.83 NODE_7882_length_1542_cov_2.260777:409-1437(-)